MYTSWDKPPLPGYKSRNNPSIDATTIAAAQVLLPILAGGLITELAYAWLKPTARRERELRAFARSL